MSNIKANDKILQAIVNDPLRHVYGIYSTDYYCCIWAKFCGIRLSLRKAVDYCTNRIHINEVEGYQESTYYIHKEMEDETMMSHDIRDFKGWIVDKDGFRKYEKHEPQEVLYEATDSGDGYVTISDDSSTPDADYGSGSEEPEHSSNCQCCNASHNLVVTYHLCPTCASALTPTTT